MAFCPNCGAQLADGVRFCGSCGSAMSAPVQATSIPGPDVTPVPPTKVKKPFPAKLIAIACACLAVVVAAVLLVPMMFGGGEVGLVLYVKDGELMTATTDDPEEPFRVTKELAYQNGANVAFSKDGSRLFYSDKLASLGEYNYAYTLYYRPTNDPEAAGTKLDSDVYDFQIGEDGSAVAYRTDCDTDAYVGTLYYHDLEDKSKIAGKVYGYRMSPDGKTVLYLTKEGELGLYRQGGEKETIAEEVSSWRYVSDALDTVVYYSEGDLYRWTSGSKPQKIASDVNIHACYESGEMYYWTENADGAYTLWEFIEDDMAAADAAVAEPIRPDWSNYTYTTYEEYAAAYNRYMADYNKYIENLSAYEQKQQRDRLRQSLKDNTVITLYSLYYYDGTAETELSDKGMYLSGEPYAADAAAMCFNTVDVTAGPKVKLSEVTDAAEAESKVRSQLKDTYEWCLAVGATATPSALDAEAMWVSFAADGTALCYFTELDTDTYTGDLYKVAISGGKAGKPELMGSEVYYFNGFFTDNGEFVYLKEYDNEKREGILCVDGKEIADDIGGMMESNGVLYCYSDMEDSTGTFNKVDGDDLVLIAEDVVGIGFPTEDTIAYLCDYNKNKKTGDLYLYRDGESVFIDDDVFRIVNGYFIP